MSGLLIVDIPVYFAVGTFLWKRVETTKDQSMVRTKHACLIGLLVLHCFLFCCGQWNAFAGALHPLPLFFLSMGLVSRPDPLFLILAAWVDRSFGLGLMPTSLIWK